MVEPWTGTLPLGDNPPTATLYYGDHVLETLKRLPDQSVQTVCTSPPYFGLRDYGADGQIGLEETPEEFVSSLVEVFREVRRVLRDDGTLWLNLGDSYARDPSKGQHKPGQSGGKNAYVYDRGNGRASSTCLGSGLKQKDLIGIPWRVALALQADGWYLRQDIIWSKVNPLPESVKDRCTKAHEYVFLLSKGPRYYYDADAIREEHKSPYSRDVLSKGSPGGDRPLGNNFDKQSRRSGERTPRTRAERAALLHPKGRNRRSVWTVTTKPYKKAHFATWPPDLVKPMILAGTPEKGSCGSCGTPWVRQVGRDCEECGAFIPHQGKKCGSCGHVRDWKGDRFNPGSQEGSAYLGNDFHTPGKGTPRKKGSMGTSNTKAHGWAPGCSCEDPSPVRATVLDPFSGSGTTGEVALKLGRNYIGIDINPEYLPLAQERITGQPQSISASETLDLLDLME